LSAGNKTQQIIMRIVFLLLFLLPCGISQSQSPYTISKDYFRTDPFANSFSSFINTLINDQALKEKIITRRSDSVLFYFEGIYSSYSPFFIPVSHCKIILAEKEDRTEDSTATPYFYYEYQLIGYAKDINKGYKDVKEEFDMLNKKFSKSLVPEIEKELKRNGQVSGKIKHYSYKTMLLKPVTLAWAVSSDQQENIIAITLRFLNISNEAFLPIPSDSP
jgi:hypothetical protein